MAFLFQRFVDHYAFEEIKKRAIFVHIDCPGQEEDANDLEKPFPTIQVRFCFCIEPIFNQAQLG